MTKVAARGPLTGHKAAELDLVTIRAALTSSSTKTRIAQLLSLEQTLNDNSVPSESIPHIFQLFLDTYPVYKDRPSRRAVQSCISAVIATASDVGTLAPFVTALHQESQKAGIAPSDAFVLVEWCCLFFRGLACAPPFWGALGPDLLHTNAVALERCYQPPSRSSVAHSALTVTRRGLRAVFWYKGLREDVIRDAVRWLTARGTQLCARNTIMLGVIAGVCARHVEAKPTLAAQKSDYLTFLAREIIGSRTPVPAHIAAGLADFLTAYVTSEDVAKDIIPPTEKGLLRAPEVVLEFLPSLLDSLPEEIDLSSILACHLMKPLLSNVKSSNAAIRQGVLLTFKAAAARSHDLQTLEQVADEILSPLQSGKVAAADQRVLHSEMLESMPLSCPIATKVTTALPTVAGKEGNEAALIAEISALSRSAAHLLEADVQLAKPVLDGYVKGLADKKLPSRRAWILKAGHILLRLGSGPDPLSDSVASFAESIATPLVESWAEVLNCPAAAGQNNLISCVYVFTTLSKQVFVKVGSGPVASVLKRASVGKECLVAEPKPSFLLNDRLYSKLCGEEDLQWCLRALASVAGDLVQVDDTVRSTWSQALIFLMCSTTVPRQVRQEACKTTSLLYVQQPVLVSEAIINGIWQWIISANSGEKDSAAAAANKLDKNELHLALRSICLSSEEAAKLDFEPSTELLEKQMCSLLVLARPDLMPKASWIKTCLRVGLDPGNLARKHADVVMQKLVEPGPASAQFASMTAATCNAAADLAFVAPELMTGRILEQIRHDLDTAELREVGPVEAAIFRTPEGTVFIDVLAEKHQTLPNKNTKDYDTLKWEDELRKQLAQKKGQQKKLGAEEQAKVKAQLRKECAIRKSIQVLEVRLLRGIGIINSLATGPPTEAALWMGPSVHSLLQAMEAGTSLITGDAGPAAYLACADKVTDRLGSIRPFIGVGTLRALGVSGLADNLLEEGLEEQITRVLYRLRFAGEQRPFDVVSLAYILPLIFVVLEKGGVGAASDERDAQIVLAIECLSFHAEVCADEVISRAEVLSTLISCMQRYSQHYKIIKDCFSDMVRCVAPNMGAEEMAVLARGAIVAQGGVRETVLQAISAEVDMSQLDFSVEIWLACHDDVQENRELAGEIWEESEFALSPQVPFQILPYLESEDGQLRRAAARALAAVCKAHPSTRQGVMSSLGCAYMDFATARLPDLDQYGMPKKGDLSDRWEARHGTAAAFKEMAAHLDKAQLHDLFSFLIEKGPLGDQNAAVRSEMLDAATAAIQLHGACMVDELMETFERALEGPDKASDAADRVNEAVVVMYGALARHLKAGDSKIPVVIDRLLSTLSTPSEAVQYAVAECLPPLVRSCGDKSSHYLDLVMDTLLHSTSYAAKRGAAYGLAGLVLGRGISVLREHRILITLKSAAEKRKETQQREGAFLAFEVMPVLLGRLMEPYVLQIVPQLLTGFGDSSAHVREACLAAAKACFARLSSYGVKQILPTLLNGLDDDQWRSKKGACELLGAMAYLDPQQLAQSLPAIIPPLTGVLNDSHKEVRSAANKSLKRFGEVISNPEVKALADILLKALSDPTRHTDEALDRLIKVQFVHYLDAPSLALVTRILQRGLSERSNTKRKAAQVIGSLAHLTERKDLLAHLPVLVSGLKLAAVDPVPTTRATASRALGSLVEKLGEDALPDLIPGLMQTLKSDSGAGDRLGSAQALSEVLAGLGTTRLEETLPTILQNVASSKPAVREGFMSLFIFLPVCFGNGFANYLSRIIPPILAGLADDMESIRETALRAGRLLVKNFATKSVDLLLPALERGLADDSYRIRISSVELVGDLLFNLTGISANLEAEEAEVSATEAGAASLLEALGEEKRNKILSALYICRCDTAVSVRSAAIAVWKALVASPRTLKELTPTLTQLIIRRLGSANMEQRVIASNALGEMIRKAGDAVISSLLPTLEDSLVAAGDTDAKQGACLALRELIMSASEEALEAHEKTFISVVRSALTDGNVQVRQAAAEAFDALQRLVGKRVVDEVMPFLLNLLRSDDSAQNALLALLTLLKDSTRSSMILPNLIPTLIASPISAFDAAALASLSQVAGPAMSRRLPSIMNALMENIVSSDDDKLRADLEAAFDTVVVSMDESEGMNTALNQLLQLVKHQDHRRRAATSLRMAHLFEQGKMDYSRFNQDIIRALLVSFDDSDGDVVQSAWAALNAFTKKLKKEEMEVLVPSTRQSLLLVGVAGLDLRGFELVKGIGAILPIFLQGLMNGSAEQRTQAALGIGDLVNRSSDTALRPFVTQITGPLIRVMSERSTDVRAAILLTLNALLDKMATALKPFIPQLQRTFARSLADTSSELIRSRAARAIGALIKFTPRVDPLIAELVAGARTSDVGVKTAMLTALYEVVSKAGANMGETATELVLGLTDVEAEATDSAMTVIHAKLLGALIRIVPSDKAHTLLKQRVLTTHFSNATILALNVVLHESRQVLLGSSLADDVPDVLCQAMLDDNVGGGPLCFGNKFSADSTTQLFVVENAILATGKYLLCESTKSFEQTKAIFSRLAAIISPGNPTDARRLALVVVRTVSRAWMDMARPHLPLLAPPVYASVRDPIIPVKLAAEAAFVELFDVVAEEARIFDRYMDGPGQTLPADTRRSMPDYFKRVGLRLGVQARERREANGDGIGRLELSNDERDDEKEIWSVANFESGADVFGHE